MHEADVGAEDDTGSAATKSHITSKVQYSGGTITSQASGLLIGQSPNYAAEFSGNGGRLVRSAAISSNDFNSTTTGTILVLFRTSSKVTEQAFVCAHSTGKQFRFSLSPEGKLHFNVISGSNSENLFSDAGGFNDGRSHLALLTSTGTGHVLGLDGVFVPASYTTTEFGGNGWIADATPTGGLCFGDSPLTGAALRGSLQNVSFHEGEITEAVFTELWTATGIAFLPAGTEKRYEDLDLPMTNSTYMAQRLGYYRLQQVARRSFLQVNTGFRAMQWSEGDALTVSIDEIAIAAQTFRIENFRYDPEAAGPAGDESEQPSKFPIQLALVEDSAALYLDMPVSRYVTPTANTGVTPGNVQVPPPTGLAASATVDGIQLSWTAPENALSVSYYQVYSGTTNAWGSATLVTTTLATSYLHALATSQTRYYWVRAVGSTGSTSIRSPDSDTSTVSATFTAGTTAVPSAPQTLGGIDGTPSSGQLTGSFTRAGSTVASRVFTATHSAGNLTVSAGSDSGEATTYTLSGDGTPNVTVTHRHTGSGQTTTLTFTVAA